MTQTSLRVDSGETQNRRSNQANFARGENHIRVRSSGALDRVPSTGAPFNCLANSKIDRPGLATFRRKIGEVECWGRIGAYAIFCKPGRI